MLIFDEILSTHIREIVVNCWNCCCRITVWNKLLIKVKNLYSLYGYIGSSLYLKFSLMQNFECILQIN